MCLPQQQIDTTLRIASVIDDRSGSNRVWCIGLFHSFEYINNYHPMALLPSPAPTSILNIADHLSKPLSTTTHQRLVTLIGVDTVDPTATADLAATASVATAAVGAAPTADTAPTVVAFASTATTSSDSVPTLLHPNPVPYFVDTGASYPIAPAVSDYLSVSQAPYGLIRSASTSVASVSKPPVDPYTLITGEEVSVDPVDLSSTDTDLVDTSVDISEFASAFEVFEV